MPISRSGKIDRAMRTTAVLMPFLLILAWTAYSVFFGSTVVTVFNRTGAALENVHVYQTELNVFTAKTLRPDAAIRLIPKPHSATAINLMFEANGQTHLGVYGGDFYESSRHCVEISILPNFSTQVQARSTCFSVARLVPFAYRDGRSDLLTADKCREMGGRVAQRPCSPGETSHGKVWRAKCPCVCCTPDVSKEATE